jgi:hypothetical protein
MLPVLLPLILGACATHPTRTAGIAAPAKADCTAFGLISYSKADTDDTIRQIKAHDAAWRAMCGPTK